MAIQRRRTRYDNRMSAGCPPAWTWLLAGILIGIFISFLFYLREVAPEKTGQAPAVSVTQKEVSASKEASSSTTSKEVKGSSPSESAPRFEFYDVLPRTEVKIPESAPSPSATATSITEDSQLNEEMLPVTTPGKYVLQVGSFRESREAEGLKAHLASLGIEAYVEQATTTGADQWHRVRVGPFTDLERLNQVRARLAENSIAAILVKF